MYYNDSALRSTGDPALVFDKSNRITIISSIFTVVSSCICSGTELNPDSWTNLSVVGILGATATLVVVGLQHVGQITLEDRTLIQPVTHGSDTGYCLNPKKLLAAYMCVNSDFLCFIYLIYKFFNILRLINADNLHGLERGTHNQHSTQIRIKEFHVFATSAIAQCKQCKIQRCLNFYHY